jgi:UDP-3-O-[3-hydroxymyristoyl] glucosamine N-acyltransferase
MALVHNGRARIGDRVAIGNETAVITEPIFVDKENVRRDG